MEQTKTVYILLTDTGTWFTRMIRLYTKAAHNHASIAFDSDLREVYSFGRKKPRNPFHGGFVRENLQGELFAEAACSLYACEVDSEVYGQMKERIERMEREASRYKYNLIGLFAVALKLEVERRDAFFCSQFVAWMLEAGGIKVADKPACQVTPVDLARERTFKPLYEGELQAYLKASRPRGVPIRAYAG